MNPLYPVVARRAGHRCEYCRAPEAIFNFPFEVEHVVPVSRDGRTEEANLALACRSCNLYKSDHLTGLDEVTGDRVQLFDPRRDSWDEHFSVDRESGAIQGQTPSGRATVGRLRMNAPVQQVARKQWMRLGLFP
jgi:hypothetical protein